MWFPQPHQVDLSGCLSAGMGRSSVRRHTAGGTGGFLAHCGVVFRKDTWKWDEKSSWVLGLLGCPEFIPCHLSHGRRADPRIGDKPTGDQQSGRCEIIGQLQLDAGLAPACYTNRSRFIGFFTRTPKELFHLNNSRAVRLRPSAAPIRPQAHSFCSLWTRMRAIGPGPGEIRMHVIPLSSMHQDSRTSETRANGASMRPNTHRLHYIVRRYMKPPPLIYAVPAGPYLYLILFRAYMLNGYRNRGSG